MLKYFCQRNNKYFCTCIVCFSKRKQVIDGKLYDSFQHIRTHDKLFHHYLFIFCNKDNMYITQTKLLCLFEGLNFYSTYNTHALVVTSTVVCSHTQQTHNIVTLLLKQIIVTFI